MAKQLIAAVLVAAVVGLVIGLVLTRDTGPSCEEWQEQWVAANDEGSGGVLGYVNLTPESEELIELRKERPEGCALPSR